MRSDKLHVPPKKRIVDSQKRLKAKTESASLRSNMVLPALQGLTREELFWHLVGLFKQMLDQGIREMPPGIPDIQVNEKETSIATGRTVPVLRHDRWAKRGFKFTKWGKGRRGAVMYSLWHVMSETKLREVDTMQVS